MNNLAGPSTKSAAEIIFIDAGINNYQELISSNSQAEIVILDSSRDGVEQITQTLANYNNLDCVHLISNGREGGIFLGAIELNSLNLDSYRDSIQSWSDALSNDADILLYGSNVAAGSNGTAFINNLSQLTTADIAASDDLTGSSDLGGNWNLEVATGKIEAKTAISSQAENTYLVLTTELGDRDRISSSSDPLPIELTDTEIEFDSAELGEEDYVVMNANSLEWGNDSDSDAEYQNTTQNDGGSSPSELKTIIDYESFADLDSLVLNGGAVEHDDSLRLTRSQKRQKGSAFFDRPLAVDADTSFSTQFQFQLSGGTNGADGFTFMLQNDSRGEKALGGRGGSLGYRGINQSLAIEFDTYFNSGHDLNHNHIAILQDGDVKNSLATANASFDLNSGEVLNAWIDYDGDRNLLEAYLADSDSKPDESIVSFNLDLSEIVGNQAFVGFSAATGGRKNNQDVLGWEFASNAMFVPSPPGMLALENSSYQIDEHDQTVEISVLRTQGTDGRVSVDYATIDNSATAGEDYIAQSGTLIFESGENRKTISIPILDDGLAEGTEELGLAIDNVQGNVTLLAPRTALVSIIDNEVELEPAIDYENFADLDSIILNGDAVGYDNNLRLTPLAKRQNGSAFFNRPLAVDADTSFSTQFEFQLSGGTTGADGFTFMLYSNNLGANALGNPGGSFGYGGLTQSLAIEFDTYLNSPHDRSNNHISILQDGDVKNPLASMDAPFDLNGGEVLNAWIDYDGDRNLLEVYLADSTVKSDLPLLSLNLELDSIVGERTFVGFSAATGGGANNHDLLSWQLTTDAELLSPSTPAVGLDNEVIVSDLIQPTAIEWTPDGDIMLVAEKGGKIKVFQNGELLATPFIDLSDLVNGTRDRGLLDIAVHPDFYNGSPYVYALYAYDPPEVWHNNGLAGADGEGNRAGRLTRITADASTNFTTAIPGSEVVILGTNSTWENFNAFVNSTNDFNEAPAGILADGTNLRDFLAADSSSHTIGSVEFGPDGALYVSNGDGTSYNRVDPRTVRVQDIDNLSGKILRIDPITGEGLADNPFYNGDKDANRSKVYQYGLRNPFRMTVDPLDGRVYVGDVGWTSWEEINASEPGANFGWPYYEGGADASLPTKEYQDLPEAQAFYDSGEPVTIPFLGLNHKDFGINAIVVGDVYRGSTFDEKYWGDLFFNDLGRGIVRNVSFDETGEITAIDTFTTGAEYVVQIAQAPDGSLYYVDLDDGVVGRWFFDE